MTFDSTSPTGTPAAPPGTPPPPWPSATSALMDAAHQELIRECARHAELTHQHVALMKRYRELLDQGTFLTATVAQDLAFDICDAERKIRAIEHQLIGSQEDRCGH